MKKSISLLLILVLCLSLCSCGEKASAEAAVSESVLEETQSREEYLTELLVSEKWISSIHLITDRYNTNVFLRTGYGIRTAGQNEDRGSSFLWTLDGDKLLVMFEDNGNNDSLWIYDEERGVFLHNHDHEETLILFPESRMDEFVKETE